MATRITASFGARVPPPHRKAGGERLKAARRALGMSSATLAALLPADMRVSPQAIRAYEGGRNAPSVPMARQLEAVIIAEQRASPTAVTRPLVEGELCRLYGFDASPATQAAAASDRIPVEELERQNALLRVRLSELEAELRQRR